MDPILFECACGARILIDTEENVRTPPTCFEPATRVVRTSFECSDCWRHKMGFRRSDKWGAVIEAALGDEGGDDPRSWWDQYGDN